MTSPSPSDPSPSDPSPSDPSPSRPSPSGSDSPHNVAPATGSPHNGAPATGSPHNAGPATGRVALVTGASAGIGRATANVLTSRGWTVLGASRRGTAGAGWRGLVMDVDSDESVREGVASAVAHRGNIDALVLAAGWGLAGPVETTTPAEAKAQFETNFWGAVRVATEALPALRARSGRIVLISSIGGQVGIPFQAYYSASKFALEGWAEALAYEVAPFGVDVTLIQPGNFRTDFTSGRREAAAGSGPYTSAFRRAVRVMEHDESNGADPVAAARVIAAQLDARRPRRRISVGPGRDRIALVAKRVLPHRWFEAVAKDGLGVS